MANKKRPSETGFPHFRRPLNKLLIIHKWQFHLRRTMPVFQYLPNNVLGFHIFAFQILQLMRSCFDDIAFCKRHFA